MRRGKLLKYNVSHGETLVIKRKISLLQHPGWKIKLNSFLVNSFQAKHSGGSKTGSAGPNIALKGRKSNQQQSDHLICEVRADCYIISDH